MAADFFEVATPDCVVDDFDGEIVAINMRTGIYFCVREAGAALWRDLVGGNSLTSIIIAAKNLDAELEEAVRLLVNELVKEGLLRISSSTPSVSSELTIHSVWQAGGRSLELEKYEDMRDLVQADPIHDVDPEQGWPVLKTN